MPPARAGGIRLSRETRATELLSREHIAALAVSAAVAVAQLGANGRALQGRAHGFACALHARTPRNHLDVQLSASLHLRLLDATDLDGEVYMNRCGRQMAFTPF